MKMSRAAVKERFLSQIEASRLLDALSTMGAEGAIAPSHADMIRLLLLTGARKAEIVEARWAEVDLSAKRMVLAPGRTKSGGSTGERRIALSDAAVAILSAQSRGKSEFIFPAARRAGATTGLQKTWEKVRLRAELPGLRLHDLRHSFASFAIADGASLPLIAKALGHSTTRVTERYAHLTDDPVQALAARAAKRILGDRNDP